MIKKLSTERLVITEADLEQELARYLPASLAKDWLEKHEQAITSQVYAQFLHNLSQKEAVFSDYDIAQQLNAESDVMGDVFQATLEKLKSSEQLIPLGPGDDGRIRYTTKTMFALERDMDDGVDRLSGKLEHYVESVVIDKVVGRYEKAMRRKHGHFDALHDDQKFAIRYLLQGGDVSVLVGRAGTGKTTVLKPVADSYRRAGFEVIGASLLMLLPINCVTALVVSVVTFNLC